MRLTKTDGDNCMDDEKGETGSPKMPISTDEVGDGVLLARGGLVLGLFGKILIDDGDAAGGNRQDMNQ